MVVATMKEFDALRREVSGAGRETSAFLRAGDVYVIVIFFLFDF
jgi:hypothetical protein